MIHTYALKLTNDSREVFNASLTFTMEDCIAYGLKWDDAEEIPTELRDLLAYQLIEGEVMEGTFGFDDDGEFTWDESYCSFNWIKIG